MPNQVIKLPNGGSLEVLYSYPLPNADGKKITTIRVGYEPGGFTPTHRHGNAFVSVTLLSGSVESQVNDGPKKTYVAGDTWSEQPGDIHTVSRNASNSEPASFIATFVCPIDQEEYVIYDCENCKVVRDA